MKNNRRSHLFSAFILIVAFTVVVFINSRGEPVVVRTNLENIPMQIGQFEGREDHFDPSVYRELNADQHVYRHYQAADGTRLSLYIGYYGTAKGGRTGHNPYACLPGGGWGIVRAGNTELAFRKGVVSLNLVTARKGDLYESVLHWYQTDKDKVLANGVQQNIQRFLNRIQYNRNDGAFVQLTITSNYDGIALAQEALKSFAEKVLLLIPEYWPAEQ
jgi:EpsI family protein